MELNRIESLLEKYFEVQTTLLEEQELKRYFSSTNVAQHLKEYQPLFNHFEASKRTEFTSQIKLPTLFSKKIKWSIAASIVFLLGSSTVLYVQTQNQKDLGTYSNPEMAFKETQKALEMLSNHVNVGVQSVAYLSEFEKSKNLVFKN